MTSDQALAGLGAIVGGGGLSAVIVSVFAYLTEARKGRKPGEGSVSIALGDAYGQTRWAEVQAGHLGALVAILARLAAIREIEAEERLESRELGDRLEGKAMRMMTEIARQAPRG